MRLDAGPGMLLALKGDVVECISRKESRNPKTTAKLTVGKTYTIVDVSYYCRRQTPTSQLQIWGYVTVINDKGDERSYPLHRFKNDGGILAEAQGRRVVVCERCYDRLWYFDGDPYPQCTPCSRRPIARPLLVLSQPTIAAPVVPKAPPSDPRPLPPGQRKISI